MRLFATFIVSTLALGLAAMPALAQNGGGGKGGEPPKEPAQKPPRDAGGAPGGAPRNPPMTAEKAKAAWQWEAKGVSKELGLSDDLATKTVNAYVDARENYKAAADKARKDAADKARGAGEGGDAEARRGAMQEIQKAMAEMRKTEADKLSANLGKFLSKEQTEKAMTALGTFGGFNGSWDQMVHAVAEFNLGDDKMYQALPPIQTYVVTTSKLRDSTDRSGIQQATRDARDKLNESMKKILNDTQMEQFQRKVGGNREPRGEGAGGPPGQGGGRRGGGGAGGDQGGKGDEGN
jgi:hypothetical protein